MSGLFVSKLLKSVSRHDNDFHKLPPASAHRTNSSLLVALFVGSGLCSLRLVGNNSAGGSSSPSVANSFWRRIQSSTLRLSFQFFQTISLSSLGDCSLSTCQFTNSSLNHCCMRCRCFCDSPCTTGIDTWTLCSPLVRCCTYPHYHWYPHEWFLFMTLLNSR